MTVYKYTILHSQLQAKGEAVDFFKLFSLVEASYMDGVLMTAAMTLAILLSCKIIITVLLTP